MTRRNLSRRVRCRAEQSYETASGGTDPLPPGTHWLLRQALTSNQPLGSRCYYLRGKNHVEVPGSFRSPEAWMRARERAGLDASWPWRYLSRRK